MPNAFDLFGDIEINTSGAQRSLHDLEVRLNKAERAIGDTEKKAAGFGKTTAVSGRQLEKMTDAVKMNRDRMTQAVTAYERGQISQAKLATVLRQTDSRVTSLNSRLKDHVARLTDAQNRAGSWLQSLSRFNTHVSLAAAGVAAFALKSGSDLENLRNKFMAIEGSAEAANRRIAKLQLLARGNVGVTIADAGEAASFLRPLNVGESTIDGITKALGRLKLGFSQTMQSSTDFLINMQQLFDQGFEAQDIKQAIGRVPIFEMLVEKAFGTKDPAKLKELKAAGQLTMDTWLSGLASAVEQNDSLSRLQETTSTKLAKIFDEINFSTGAVTERFLAYLKPELDAALKGLQTGDYSSTADAIGRAIGKSIGAAMRGALEAEIGGAGGSSLFRNIAEGVLEGFNANSAAAIIKTFFNKIGMEVQTGIIDLAASVFNASPVGMTGKVADAILEQLGFTVDETNSGIKRINSHFGETRAAVIEQYNKNAVEILKASKASADKIASDPSISDAVRASAQKRSEELQKQIEVMTAAAAAAVEKQGTEQAKRSIESVLNRTTDDSVATAYKGGASIGENLAGGMRAGISGGQAGVITAAVDLATRAYRAAKDVLGIQSPSKVFMKIGEDVAQGFIEGITRMRASVHAAMADLVDVRNIKGLTKKDAPGVELIRDLINEYNDLNPLTAKQALLADIEAGKYGKLNAQLKDMALRLRDRIDLMKQIEERNKQVLDFRDALTGASFDFPDLSMFVAEGTGTGLSDAFEKEVAKMEAGWQGLIQLMGEPPPIDTWGNFWGGMMYHIQKFKESLPSLKEVIGVNLIDSISRVGDVFANAVAYWDGTAKGFFQSLAQGFRQMIQQIIAEIVRLAVIKAITSIIGSFAGGIGGASAGGVGHEIGHLGLAAGGLVRGQGSSISDSIPAWLSNGEFVLNAKAVKNLGVGFLERLNSGFVAPMAMAGGGMVGGPTTYNNSWAPQFTINVSGGGNPERVKQSVKQGINEAMRTMEREKMRRK